VPLRHRTSCSNEATHPIAWNPVRNHKSFQWQLKPGWDTVLDVVLFQNNCPRKTSKYFQHRSEWSKVTSPHDRPHLWKSLFLKFAWYFVLSRSKILPNGFNKKYLSSGTTTLRNWNCPSSTLFKSCYSTTIQHTFKHMYLRRLWNKGNFSPAFFFISCNSTIVWNNLFSNCDMGDLASNDHSRLSVPLLEVAFQSCPNTFQTWTHIIWKVIYYHRKVSGRLIPDGSVSLSVIPQIVRWATSSQKIIHGCKGR
jgi:hypothetical protein